MAYHYRNFPNEVLAIILEQASDMRISLWLCGDKAFNARICHLPTSFSCPTELHEAYKWPQALEEFRSLVSVSFRADLLREPLHMVFKKVKKLPPTLKHLVLRFEGADLLLFREINLSLWAKSGFSTRCVSPFSPNSAWYDSLMAIPAIFEEFHLYESASMASSTSSLKSSKSSLESAFWDVSALFPVLETLSIEDPKAKSSRHIGPTEYRLLPSSLITLELSSFALYKDFSALPRGLTSLVCQRTFPESNLPHLSLKSLPPSLATFIGSEGTLQEVLDLPASITKVEARHVPPNQIASLLPPSLKALSLDFDSSYRFNQEFSLLPRGLTEVGMAGTLWAADNLSLLPRTVTHLRQVWALNSTLGLGTLSLQELYDSVWPPLKMLHFERRVYKPYSISDFHLLPRTLTSIENIRLKSSDEPSRNHYFLNLATALPPSLTHLSISSCVSSAQLQDVTQLQDMSDLDLTAHNSTAFLPPSLASLQASPGLFRSEYRILPSELNTLILHQLHCDCFQLLPSNLSILSAVKLIGLSATTTFQDLPRSITDLSLHLAIDKVGSIVLQPPAFATLPPNLKTLRLHNGLLTSSIFLYLPTNICSLRAAVDEESFCPEATPPTPTLFGAISSLVSSFFDLSEPDLRRKQSKARCIPLRWLKWLSFRDRKLDFMQALIDAWPKGEPLTSPLKIYVSKFPRNLGSFEE